MKINFNKTLTATKMALAIAATAICSAASADVLTFENFDPDIYTHGDTLQQDGKIFTTLGNGGFDGAIVNGADTFTCAVIACPASNDSNYYTGLNDGGLSLKLLPGQHMTGLDFAFIAPVNMSIGFAVGQLEIHGLDDNGQWTHVAQDFDGQDANGNFVFSQFNLGNTAFGTKSYKEIIFNACLYDGSGACVNPSQNQAQFAIDNISTVPEPTSVALLGISVLGMLAAARRRKFN